MRTDFNTLRIECSDGIMQLILNRPAVRNAVSHEMQSEIDLALDEAEIDPEVKAVILRGEGKHFSAGHDLSEEFGGKSFPDRTFPFASPSMHPQFSRAWYFRKPLIGAVHNYVGAWTVALVGCCDFNIAADNTRFSCEVFKGAAPEIEWLPLLVQFPMRVIEKFWLMGGWMDAESALHFQFVQRVVPEERLLEEALRWATQVALIPAERFSRAKDQIRRSIEIMGLSNLHAVLERPMESAKPDRSAIAGVIQDRGVMEAVRLREQGFDPDIARI